MASAHFYPHCFYFILQDWIKVKVSLIAHLGLKKKDLRCIFYSGVSGLWLGVCSLQQPLVPTGVKSPSSVSERIEAPKRSQHSSISTNQWKHFLCPCPPQALRTY